MGADELILVSVDDHVVNFAVFGVLEGDPSRGRPQIHVIPPQSK